MATARVSTGIDIEYEVRGEGEPLLLVMGLSGQLVAWPDAFVDGLVARGFQVIVFDNRDIGLSTAIDADVPTMGRTLAASISPRFARSSYLLADMAADAVGLLDALGIVSAHVAGISMGGMISQQIAIDHPARVRSLTSIMSTTGSRTVGRPTITTLLRLGRLARGPKDTAVDREIDIARIISGSSHDPAEARVIAQRSMDRHYGPDGVARQTAAIMASPDRTPGLRNVRVPTLVVHGLEDVLVTPSGGLATAKAVPGARLLAFPDMGHNLPAARIDEIIEAMVDNAARAGFESPVHAAR
jgi:pimeloyl-ACP methyl ester carboxylesterase